jgi:hypothetical protein
MIVVNSVCSCDAAALVNLQRWLGRLRCSIDGRTIIAGSTVATPVAWASSLPDARAEHSHRVCPLPARSILTCGGHTQCHSKSDKLRSIGLPPVGRCKAPASSPKHTFYTTRFTVFATFFKFSPHPPIFSPPPPIFSPLNYVRLGPTICCELGQFLADSVTLFTN